MGALTVLTGFNELGLEAGELDFPPYVYSEDWSMRPSFIPRGTRLFFPSGAVLAVTDQNAPCRIAGAEVERNLPASDGLALRFAAAAKRLRGVVAYVDRPGIIAQLATALAAEAISIDAVLQLPKSDWRDLPFVITVEPATEQSIRAAIARMAELNFLIEPPLALPLEEPL